MIYSKASDLFNNEAGSYDAQCENAQWQSPGRTANALTRHFYTLPVRGTLIDLGCGTGQVLERLKGKFSRAVAVDVSPNMLGLCRDRSLADDYRLCDLEQTGWDLQERAVAVTASGVLDFVPNPGMFLRNVFDHLEPHGFASLTYQTYALHNVHQHSAQTFPVDPYIMKTTAKKIGFDVLEQSVFDAYSYNGSPVQYGLMVLTRN